MYEIIFNDGKIRLLVATEMESKEECEEIISKQEKPQCYHIEEVMIDNQKVIHDI